MKHTSNLQKTKTSSTNNTSSKRTFFSGARRAIKTNLRILSVLAVAALGTLVIGLGRAAGAGTAVLSITPPQLGAHSAMGGLLNVAGTATTTTPISQTTQTATTPSTTAAWCPAAANAARRS